MGGNYAEVPFPPIRSNIKYTEEIQLFILFSTSNFSFLYYLSFLPTFKIKVFVLEKIRAFCNILSGMNY